MADEAAVGGVNAQRRIERELLPELLLRLFSRRHSGWVTLNSTDLPPARFAFGAGVPSSVDLPRTAPAYSAALSELLPKSQLELALAHAEAHELDPVGAALALALLPPESEQHLRRLLVDKVLLAHAAAKGGVIVDSAVDPEGSIDELAPTRRDPETEVDLPKPAQVAGFLSVIARMICELDDLDYYRGRLKSTWVDPLLLQGVDGFHRHLEGRFRRTLLSLSQLPQSLATLLERGEATEDELIGIVYTLRAAGLMRSRWSGASAPRASVPNSPPSQAKSSARPAIDPPAPVPPVPVPPVPAPPAPRASGAPPLTPKAPTGPRAPSNSAVPSASVGDSPRISGISGTRRLTPPEGLPERPSTRSPAMPPSKEHLVEANALDAWMRAVEDPQVGPKALAFAEKAAAHFPNNSRILFYLGCLCAQQGREGRAHACLARALELDPDHDEAQRELGLLRARRSGRSGALPRVDVPRKGRKAR